MGNGFSKGESDRIRRRNESSSLILTRLIFECPTTVYPCIPLVNVLTLLCTRNHTDFKWQLIA